MPPPPFGGWRGDLRDVGLRHLDDARRRRRRLDELAHMTFMGHSFSAITKRLARGGTVDGAALGPAEDR
jgi:hypothetical protein